MNLKKLLLMLTLILGLMGCNDYQNDKSILGDVESTTNLTPATPVAIPEDGTEVVGEDGVTFISKLNDLELFDLWDLFFSKFIVPINKEGEGFDTKVDYTNLHKLYSSRDRLFIHMINSIEKKMNDIDLSIESDEFKKAFYINSYNYAAIMVVIRNYVKSNGSRIKSIKNISKVFKSNIINISGSPISLDGIEKNKLQTLMSHGGNIKNGVADARFHFAVICASGGCPVTLDKAYRAETLEENLDFITREGLRLPRILTRDGSSLGLTKIISLWYKKDFESDSGSVQNFLAKHGVTDTSGRIKKLPYDWDLNIFETSRATPDLSELETRFASDGTNRPIQEDEEEFSVCPSSKKYKAVMHCQTVMTASEALSELNVCIYQKRGDSSSLKIDQSYLLNGKTNQVTHKFKSDSLNFKTSKKKLFGSKRKFNLDGSEYTFETKTASFTASCEVL